MKIIGIDGCKAGWFGIQFNGNEWDLNIYETISSLKDIINDFSLVVIDIPIGLRSNENLERKCDTEARKLLGLGRGSSVFPAPCRKAIYSSDYESANKVNRNEVGRGLSKQSRGIAPKIKEVDQMLRSNVGVENKIVESHPEVAFTYLNDMIPMRYKKKSIQGIQERLNVLIRYEKNAEIIYCEALDKYRRKDVQRDDIIDALCMSVTGKIMVNSARKTIPEKPEYDEYNIPMQICVFK